MRLPKPSIRSSSQPPVPLSGGGGGANNNNNNGTAGENSISPRAAARAARAARGESAAPFGRIARSNVNNGNGNAAKARETSLPPSCIRTSGRSSSPSKQQQRLLQRPIHHAAATAVVNSQPPRPQPPRSPEELQFATRTLTKLVQDSYFFPLHDSNNRVQTIREGKLDVGNVIGKGGFCEVRSCWLKGRQRHQHRSFSRGSSKSRAAPTNTAVPNHGGGANGGGGGGGGGECSSSVGGVETTLYAMKYLSPTKTKSSRVFQRGIADLAMEACFLSFLRHENIIGLHYVSKGSLEESYNCDPRHTSRGLDRPTVYGYFLVLDPLHESLADRIDHAWVPRILPPGNDAGGNNGGGSGGGGPVKCPKVWDRIRLRNGNRENHGEPSDSKEALMQRLGILKAVASALRYLHDECRIIFRDIKPDNIGFYRRYYPQCSCGNSPNNNNNNNNKECTCYEEITKLFDFGLAKELKSKYRKTHPAYPDQTTYKLTGCTGSRRYMAPEVCFSDPYNVKADVYSFGMLLYQVASLVTPFDGYSSGKHEREVLRQGVRPDVRIPSVSTAFTLKGKKQTFEMPPSSPASNDDGSVPTESETKNLLLASKTKRYWPKDLPLIMKECWDYDMRYRPEMTEVCHRLERCIDDLALSSQNHHHLNGMLGGWLKSAGNSKDDSAGTMETAPLSSANTVGTPAARGHHHPPQEVQEQHPHGQQQQQQQYQQQSSPSMEEGMMDDPHPPHHQHHHHHHHHHHQDESERKKERRSRSRRKHKADRSKSRAPSSSEFSSRLDSRSKSRAPSVSVVGRRDRSKSRAPSESFGGGGRDHRSKSRAPSSSRPPDFNLSSMAVYRGKESRNNGWSNGNNGEEDDPIMNTLVGIGEMQAEF